MTPPVSGCSLPLGERHIPAAGPPQGTTSSSAGHGQRLSHPSPAATGHAPRDAPLCPGPHSPGAFVSHGPADPAGSAEKRRLGLENYWLDGGGSGGGAGAGPGAALLGPARNRSKRSSTLGNTRNRSARPGRTPRRPVRARSEPLGQVRNRSELLGTARSRSDTLGAARQSSARPGSGADAAAAAASARP